MAEAAVSMEEYAVSEACIACDACCNDFPDIFIMNGDHTRAIAKNLSPKGKFDPWDIIYDCPVDAISLIKGELPPPPADKKPASQKEASLPPPDPADIVDNRPWEIRWAEAKLRGGESYWERMKRYGMATSVDETAKQYLVRVALPEKVPDHPFKFKWNLPEKMPDYKFDIHLTNNGKRLYLKGWLEDQRVTRLCGVANSFPDRFLRELELAEPAKDLKFNYNPKDKVLDIIIDKTVS
jgi:ferredoxin